MDPKAHKRFLAYLERYEYFRQPGLEKLGREQWLELDQERTLRETTKGSATPEEIRRLKALRRVLLVD